MSAVIVASGVAATGRRVLVVRLCVKVADAAISGMGSATRATGLGLGLKNARRSCWL